MRNRLCHGLWGRSHAIPNSLLVLDADIELDRGRALTEILYSAKPLCAFDEHEVPTIHPKNVFVYFEEDLKEALALVRACYEYSQALCTMATPFTCLPDDPPDANRSRSRTHARVATHPRAVQRSRLELVSPKCNTLMQTAVG